MQNWGSYDCEVLLPFEANDMEIMEAKQWREKKVGGHEERKENKGSGD